MLLKKMKVGLLLLLMAASLAACNSDSNKEVICTEEFKIIGVKVIGGKLDDFYTLRTATADTIRFTTSGQYPLNNWYPILDDSFQPLLEGKREDFVFVGIKNTAEIVREQFSIGADVCHIIKYSGPVEVSY
jgi:hypothetical protein